MQFGPNIPTRCALYCRISLARFGETIKVEDQEKVCRELAKFKGWTISEAHVFVDPNRSAWRRDRKRPAWDAMLLAVERGEIDGIIVYHGDRLIRQPWDLEVLINLADQRGIRITSPTGERDLDNADDRFILRIEAAQACKESDNTSRRLKRYYDRQAEAGVVRLGGRGGRAYGFEPDGVTHRLSDVEVLREVARRVLAGEKTGVIVRDLNARGLATVTGNPWEHGSLKRILLKPRLAGLVSHHGRVVGPASWDPILDRETWEQVVAVLEGKAAAFSYTHNEGKYLLSGIAVCSGCDRTVVVRHGGEDWVLDCRACRRRLGRARGDAGHTKLLGRWDEHVAEAHHGTAPLRGLKQVRTGLLGYGCINRACRARVQRAVRYVDPWVEGHVLERLSDDRLRRAMQGATPETGEMADRIAALERHRRQTFREFANDPQLGPDVLRITIPRIDQQIAELREAVAAAAHPSTLDGLWRISVDGWRALPLSRRRAAVRATVQVTILPSRRGPGFDERTVRVLPASLA